MTSTFDKTTTEGAAVFLKSCWGTFDNNHVFNNQTEIVANKPSKDSLDGFVQGASVMISESFTKVSSNLFSDNFVCLIFDRTNTVCETNEFKQSVNGILGIDSVLTLENNEIIEMQGWAISLKRCKPIVSLLHCRLTCRRCHPTKSTRTTLECSLIVFKVKPRL